MPTRLRGDRGRGNHGRIIRSIDSGQLYRNSSNHPERDDDMTSSRREYVGDVVLGAYSAASAYPPVLPNP